MTVASCSCRPATRPPTGGASAISSQATHWTACTCSARSACLIGAARPTTSFRPVRQARTGPTASCSGARYALTRGGAASVPVGGTVPRVNVPTLIVTGPVGVGKTTVADEMGYALRDGKVPYATVDFDRLRACYPRPAEDDRWGNRIGLTNLAAIWKNYRAAGARRLLIACVIERRSDLDGFREAVPGADIQARVRKRSHGTGIEWDLNRAMELVALMDAQPVEDMLVDTEDRAPPTIARDILQRAGWLPT